MKPPGRGRDPRRELAPATRLGLVLLLLAFAGVVASGQVPAIAAVLDRFAGLPLLVLMVVVVSLTRALRLGAGWARAPLRRSSAGLLFTAGLIVSVSGAYLSATAGPSIAVVAVIGDVLAAAIAAALPAAETDRS